MVIGPSPANQRSSLGFFSPEFPLCSYSCKDELLVLMFPAMGRLPAWRGRTERWSKHSLEFWFLGTVIPEVIPLWPFHSSLTWANQLPFFFRWLWIVDLLSTMKVISIDCLSGFCHPLQPVLSALLHNLGSCPPFYIMGGTKGPSLLGPFPSIGSKVKCINYPEAIY